MPAIVVVSNPPQKSGGRSPSYDYDTRVIQQFLRVTGVDGCHLKGSLFELRGYIRGCLS